MTTPALLTAFTEHWADRSTAELRLTMDEQLALIASGQTARPRAVSAVGGLPDGRDSAAGG
jgi:hypothetical protein